jgi:hypothetical protein
VLGSTLGLVPEPTPDPEPSTVYIVRDVAGVVVDLGRRPVAAPHPETHALDLLHFLIRDHEFVGQAATEKAIKKYYFTVCRSDGVRPFPWLSVLRHLNRVLRAIYGPAYRKTYMNLPGHHRRKRRVYRIPTLEEFQEARERMAEAIAKVA